MILSNTIMDEAIIDPKLNEEEEQRLRMIQLERIWYRLRLKYATKHNDLIIWVPQWWED